MKNLDLFEKQLLAFISQEMQTDLAHDINHVLRVVETAKRLAKEEEAMLEVVVPAAYLHDCFTFAKDHPQRQQSSFFAAEKATEFLNVIGYETQYLAAIQHAIVAHSFSANVQAATIEAKVVQDADRLDALGAIGIARCFQVSAKFGRPLYSADDPFCLSREADDAVSTIDHFYSKLLKLADKMQTKSAKAAADSRIHFMRSYLQQLAKEI